MSSVTNTDLDRLYLPPSEAIQKAVLPHLISFHEAYISAATFFSLASGSQEGLDVSPRGGPAGFVKVLDSKHVAFADWPGNNRIETMRNLMQDDRLAMLFLFPGLSVFLRLNGRGTVSTSPDLLSLLEERQKQPKTAIVVAIDQVLFHCGKAITRAKLWDTQAHSENAGLPTVGQMKAALTGGSPANAETIDIQYEQSIKKELY